MPEPSKKLVWSDRETEILVDEVILRKELLFGAHSDTITNNLKRDGWKEITVVLATECPQTKEQTKDIRQTNQKYHNLKKLCLKDVAKYNESIRGTGGGPKFTLKPLYVKFMEGILGRENPLLQALEGSYDLTAAAATAAAVLGRLFSLRRR